MVKKELITGDFGFPKRAITRTQVVAIFDLIGFTDAASNKELVTSVVVMEKQLELVLEPHFYWDERTRGQIEAPRNDILLRSTGDGYIIAFREHHSDLEILKHLVDIHKSIQKYHGVNLGVNKGENYVVADMNDRTNVVGWGINFAARALQFAKDGQIICTEHFAGPLLETHGDQITSDLMIDLGERTIKNTKLRMYNYYKQEDFGAPFVEPENL